jgi:hypothetical protein
MNDAILSLIITGGFAWITLVIRYCFLSKCDVIKCGCCEIHRAVGQETTQPEIQVAVTTPKGMNEQKSFSKI